MPSTTDRAARNGRGVRQVFANIAVHLWLYSYGETVRDLEHGGRDPGDGRVSHVTR
jgi:hypothetical protein